ncbi:MGMT family protein [Blastococcus capsensis]|nr:MGMT family protein [Blastococcus capsensis]MDK3256600.1 MGMT family protein [Blastococcus capsensis]
MLFEVDGRSARPAATHSLREVDLEERAHLQEWVLDQPQVLGDDVLIVTSEFDRWTGQDGTRARDRLDVLGLDSSGRLVVAELKRDDSGGDVHLQAITYAALVSRFTLETLADAYAQYRTRRGEPLTIAEAADRIAEHVGGDLDPDVLRRPRLVLIAGSFPRQVTHTAVWLSEMGVDISLISVTVWRVEGRLVAGFTKVYPTAEVEEFTLAPVRAEARVATEKAAERSRTASTVRRLVDAGLLEDGEVLTLLPTHGTTAATRAAIASWVAEAPERGRASWQNDPQAPLVWAADGQSWKPTTLARHILREAAGVEASIQGPAWWTTEGGVDLTELVNGTSDRRDWSDLHRYLEALPAGRWTTYGDLAQLVGTAAQPLGNHVMKCSDCTNAYRVLGSTGRRSPGFSWSDPDRTESVEEVLAAEGVRFVNGAADPVQRSRVEELRRLVTATQ